MKKVAVILANGFEEIEALTPVDVLRRAEIECHTIGLTEKKSSDRIKFQCLRIKFLKAIYQHMT